MVLVLLMNGRNDRAKRVDVELEVDMLRERGEELKATAIRLGSSGYRPSISTIRHCEDWMLREGFAICVEEQCQTSRALLDLTIGTLSFFKRTRSRLDIGHWTLDTVVE